MGRLWAARREVDMDRGGMMQVLRSSNNEDEVLRAVEALEKGGALTLKDYTTLLAALKRIKQWKVSHANHACHSGMMRRGSPFLKLAIGLPLVCHCERCNTGPHAP